MGVECGQVGFHEEARFPPLCGLMGLDLSAHGPVAGERLGRLGTVFAQSRREVCNVALVHQSVTELRGRVEPAMEQGFARSWTMSKRRTRDKNGERGDIGSRRWTERQGQQVVAAWRNSGLAASEFARRQGISQQRLSWWCKRLGESSAREGAGRGRTSIISLVPAEVRAHAPVSAASSLAVMRLPCGISIEFADAGAMSVRWVASLVGALSRES
jgi:hypothetical protein